jgi:DNA sulfur modification protein DndE
VEPGVSIKQVRLSSQAKEQLIRLKARTGIAHWNVLCRWAFCLSLRQPSPPAPIEITADSNVEMTWQVFGGDAHELFLAVLKERCQRDGLGVSDDVLVRQFRLHLHRGIGYLAAPQATRSIADLIRLATEDSDMHRSEESELARDSSTIQEPEHGDPTGAC